MPASDSCTPSAPRSRPSTVDELSVSVVVTDSPALSTVTGTVSPGRAETISDSSSQLPTGCTSTVVSRSPATMPDSAAGPRPTQHSPLPAQESPATAATRSVGTGAGSLLPGPQVTGTA